MSLSQQWRQHAPARCLVKAWKVGNLSWRQFVLTVLYQYEFLCTNNHCFQLRVRQLAEKPYYSKNEHWETSADLPHEQILENLRLILTNKFCQMIMVCCNEMDVCYIFRAYSNLQWAWSLAYQRETVFCGSFSSFLSFSQLERNVPAKNKGTQ